MEQYKKILVCLDQSNLDEDLIEATNAICAMSPREVTFINVIPDFNIPAEMQKTFPNIVEKALDERKSEIREILDEKFTWPDANIVIKLVQGLPSKTILNYSIKGDYDLIVVGRKTDRSGVLKNRLARRANCSILIIAEGHRFDLRNILIPIDFSDHSKMAIEKAVTFARLVEQDVNIFAQNIFTVPSGYHYTGKSYDEFVKVMEENSKKEYEVFFKKVDNDGKEIQPIYSHNNNDEFVSDIRVQAKKLNADLIIIGAKGQTTTSALFIGSKAERIVQMKTNSSMLMVRKKGAKSGFRDFIDSL